MNDTSRPQSLRHMAEIGCACAAHAVELGFAGVAAKILQATQKLLAEHPAPQTRPATTA